LSKVDPSGPAHVHRLLNSVLAVVHIIPGDRIIKDKPTGDVKPEVKPEVEETGEGEEVKIEDGEKVDESKVDEEDDEDDEVPYIEDVGTREVAGFIVMYVFFPAFNKFLCFDMSFLPRSTLPI
jgi:polyribonucleotide 5'-hydroxyl-kinase